MAIRVKFFAPFCIFVLFCFQYPFFRSLLLLLLLIDWYSIKLELYNNNKNVYTKQIMWAREWKFGSFCWREWKYYRKKNTQRSNNCELLSLCADIMHAAELKLFSSLTHAHRIACLLYPKISIWFISGNFSIDLTLAPARFIRNFSILYGQLIIAV